MPSQIGSRLGPRTAATPNTLVPTPAPTQRLSDARIEAPRATESAKAEPRPALTVDTTVLDFGSCAYGSKRKVEAIGGKSVTVSNNTANALPVVWAVRAPYVIAPSTAVIEPNSSATFTVSLVYRH